MRLARVLLGGLAVVTGCAGAPGKPVAPDRPEGEARYRLEFDGVPQAHFSRARFLELPNYLTASETAIGLRVVDLAIYNGPAAGIPPAAGAAPLATPSAATPAAAAPPAPTPGAATPAAPTPAAGAPAAATPAAATPSAPTPPASTPAAATAAAAPAPTAATQAVAFEGADPAAKKIYRRVVLEDSRVLGPLLGWAYEWEGGKTGARRNAVVVTPSGVRYDLTGVWPAGITGRELARLRATAGSAPWRELPLDKLELAVESLEKAR